MASITKRRVFVSASLPALFAALKFFISFFTSFTFDLFSFLERQLNSSTADLIISGFGFADTAVDGIIKEAEEEYEKRVRRRNEATKKNRKLIKFILIKQLVNKYTLHRGQSIIILSTFEDYLHNIHRLHKRCSYKRQN